MDVTGLPSVAAENIGHDRIARQGLERERGDEFKRARGHCDVYFVPALHELADKIRRLVRGDGTGNAYNDGFHGSGKRRRVAARSARMTARKLVRSSSIVPPTIV